MLVAPVLASSHAGRWAGGVLDPSDPKDAIFMSPACRILYGCVTCGPCPDLPWEIGITSTDKICREFIAYLLTYLLTYLHGYGCPPFAVP
jgi:hypothetical protein